MDFTKSTKSPRFEINRKITATGWHAVLAAKAFILVDESNSSFFLECSASTTIIPTLAIEDCSLGTCLETLSAFLAFAWVYGVLGFPDTRDRLMLALFST